MGLGKPTIELVVEIIPLATARSSAGTATNKHFSSLGYEEILRALKDNKKPLPARMRRPCV